LLTVLKAMALMPVRWALTPPSRSAAVFSPVIVSANRLVSGSAVAWVSSV
jgi:hypothetical protein